MEEAPPFVFSEKLMFLKNKLLSMKKLLPSCLLAGLLALTHKDASAQNWQLVWSDEFTNGISADWVFETGGGGWGNNELEYYRAEMLL